MSINVTSLTNVRVSVTILISAKVCLRDHALPALSCLRILFSFGFLHCYSRVTVNVQERTKSTFTKHQKSSKSSWTRPQRECFTEWRRLEPKTPTLITLWSSALRNKAFQVLLKTCTHAWVRRCNTEVENHRSHFKSHINWKYEL